MSKTKETSGWWSHDPQFKREILMEDLDRAQKTQMKAAREVMEKCAMEAEKSNLFTQMNILTNLATRRVLRKIGLFLIVPPEKNKIKKPFYLTEKGKLVEISCTYYDEKIVINKLKEIKGDALVKRANMVVNSVVDAIRPQ